MGIDQIVDLQQALVVVYKSIGFDPCDFPRIVHPDQQGAACGIEIGHQGFHAGQFDVFVRLIGF